jgi:hypothetical protein
VVQSGQLELFYKSVFQLAIQLGFQPLNHALGLTLCLSVGGVSLLVQSMQYLQDLPKNAIKTQQLFFACHCYFMGRKKKINVTPYKKKLVSVYVCFVLLFFESA